MERRYQVFISSTYSDLMEERGELIQVILELGCIPAGMELFPATTEAAWELIKSVIDDSDYYCLVIGGRYGSLDASGISYTEKEYDYAISKGKPLIAFLHGDPGGIPTNKTDGNDEARQKLAALRSKVESQHHCKYWKTPADLGGIASRSLINLMRSHPGEGWVRGRYAATSELQVELANLRARVAELTSEVDRSKGDEKRAHATDLAGGEDVVDIQFSAQLEGEADKRDNFKVTVTWDRILKYVGPKLLNECTDEDFEEKLKLCCYHSFRSPEGKKVNWGSIVLPYVVFDKVKIQLRALGYMVSGSKRRAVSDTHVYWKLTEEGEHRLISVQAVKKSSGGDNGDSAATQGE